MFCINCGKSIEQNSQNSFCIHCGHPIKNNNQNNNNADQTQNLTTPTNNNNEVKKKLQLTKKQKILIITASIFAVIFAAFYFVGNYLTSPKYVVQQFINSVEEEDISQLTDLLIYRDSDDDIEEESLRGFVDYLKNDSDHYQIIIESLETQANTINNNNQPEDFEDYMESILFGSQTDDTVTLEKSGSFLFFDTYKLSIEPVYITIGTNQPDTSIYLFDEELFVTTQNQLEYIYGPVLPGHYHFKSIYENDFGTFENEEEVWASYDMGVNLNISGDYYYLTYPFEGESRLPHRIYIDDELTDITIEETQDVEVGPIPENESFKVKMEIDFPWGTMVSEEETLEKPDSLFYSNNFHFTFDLDDNLKEQMIDAIDRHFDEYMAALETGEITALDHLEHISTIYRNEYRDIRNLDHYEKQVTGLQFDLDSFYLENWNGDFEVSILVNELTEVIRNSNSEDERNRYNYTFVYDGEKWDVYRKSMNFYSLNHPENINYTSKKAIVGQSNDSESSNDELAEDEENSIKEVVTSYVNYLVDAINEGDYSIVSPYIKEGSSLEKAQQSLVTHLYENGTKENVESISVSSIEKVEDKYEVITDETIEIIYESGNSEVENYSWTYTVEKVNDSFQLTDIE